VLFRSVLGFAEHAPLPFDNAHRMTESETRIYLRNAKNRQSAHANHLQILVGLEADYAPSATNYLHSLLPKYDCDFILGSVHYLDIGDEHIDIWQYDRMQDSKLLDQYFKQLVAAAHSGLYDGLAHPDVVMLAGLPFSQLKDRFVPVIEACKKNQIAWEINTSGPSKKAYNPTTGSVVEGRWTYPVFDLIEAVYEAGVPLTLASDSHKPEQLMQHYECVIPELLHRGIQTIHIIKKHQKIPMDISVLGFPERR